jgi:hypothetical protein
MEGIRQNIGWEIGLNPSPPPPLTGLSDASSLLHGPRVRLLLWNISRLKMVKRIIALIFQRSAICIFARGGNISILIVLYINTAVLLPFLSWVAYTYKILSVIKFINKRLSISIISAIKKIRQVKQMLQRASHLVQTGNNSNILCKRFRTQVAKATTIAYIFKGL